MTSFLPDAHSEPILKVLHRMPQRFLLHSCDFLTNGKFFSSECFNSSQYSISIWNCASTLNIELSKENTLDSNYGIILSKDV